MGHGVTIEGVQMVQEVPTGALTISMKKEVDSVVMKVLVGVTGTVMEEALSGVALEVLAEDQAHIQVDMVEAHDDLKPSIMHFMVPGTVVLLLPLYPGQLIGQCKMRQA